MNQFYGYKKCGTSRKVEAYLQNKKVTYSFIDITEHPPTAKQLKDASKKSGVPARKMFNTSGKEYRDGGYKDRVANMSDDEIFKELASNGKLIKRPVILGTLNASVGYDETLLAKFKA